MSETDINAQALAEACAEAMYSNDNASQAMGIKLVSVAPGRAVMSMTVRDDMVNGHDICHGGFVFALADSTFAFACNSYNRNTVAQGCSIEYVGPAHSGDVLTAVAEEKHQGGRTGVYDVTVSNQNNDTLAIFRGKSYRIKGHLVEVDTAK